MNERQNASALQLQLSVFPCFQLIGNYLNRFGLQSIMKIVSIVGTRPNFMKIASLINEFKKRKIKHILVHTGQHYDKQMPEEINRILTDDISSFLFTTEESAMKNLINERIPKERIFFVGNVMIDTLLQHKKSALKSKILKSLNLKKNGYCVLTLHRPSNVDTKEGLEKIMLILEKIQNK